MMDQEILRRPPHSVSWHVLVNRVRLSCDSKMAIGVNISVNGRLSLC